MYNNRFPGSRILFLFAFLLATVTDVRIVFALTPSPEDWRDQIIYQIITDRFYDGDYSNNTANPAGTYNPSGGLDIHGGDFKGLTQKLDYLKGSSLSR